MSLYLILEVLLPPLRSDVGRQMLREFHFTAKSFPEKLCVIRARLSFFRVDATFVPSGNLLLNLRRVSGRSASPQAQCAPSRSRPAHHALTAGAGGAVAAL